MGSVPMITKLILVIEILRWESLENIRKRVDARLVTDKNKLLKMTSKATYVS